MLNSTSSFVVVPRAVAAPVKPPSPPVPPETEPCLEIPFNPATNQRFGGYNYSPTESFWEVSTPENQPIGVPATSSVPVESPTRTPVQARPALKHDVLERQATTHVAEQTPVIEAVHQQNPLSPTVQRAEQQQHQQKEVVIEKHAHEEKHGTQGLAPKTRKENNLKTVALYASTALNASIFLSNLAGTLSSTTLRQNPQPLNVMGSLINLGSVFLPDPLKLPAFVAGTALFMGGNAITQTHSDRCDVSRPVQSKEAFEQIAIGGRWNSYGNDKFPHPEYVRNNPVRQAVMDINEAATQAKKGLGLLPLKKDEVLPDDWQADVKARFAKALADAGDSKKQALYPKVAPRPTQAELAKLADSVKGLEHAIEHGLGHPDKQAVRTQLDTALKAVAAHEPPRFGFAHLAHPGFLGQMAQEKYYNVFYPLIDGIKLGGVHLKVPTVLASTAGSVTQLGWMAGKMLTDWNFAHDVLVFAQRKEFMKGTEYTIPNSRGYALALGAVLPLAMLGTAGAVQVLQKHTKGKKNAVPDATSEQQRKDDPFSRHKSGAFELVANASSIMPQLANLLMVPIIAKEGIGKPVHIMPMGTNIQHAITPRFNANLIQAGSLGALASATLATISDLGLLPRYVAHLSDIAFMGLSGMTQMGLARNTFEEEFRIAQAFHLFPTPSMFEHMRQYKEADKKGWLNLWPKNRVPTLPKV